MLDPEVKSEDVERACNAFSEALHHSVSVDTKMRDGMQAALKTYSPWNGGVMVEGPGGEYVRVDEITGNDLCYSKAVARGQRTFTLVEQDPTAVETIAFWIMKNIHTAPPEKLRKALQECIDMRGFEHTKHAD
jgi:hypothetical protein